MTIEQINDHLEKKAQEAEQLASKANIKTNVPEHLRELKNFHLQDRFSLPTCDFGINSYIINYIKENNLNYRVEGFTGYCDFIAVKN